MEPVVPRARPTSCDPRHRRGVRNQLFWLFPVVTLAVGSPPPEHTFCLAKAVTPCALWRPSLSEVGHALSSQHLKRTTDAIHFARTARAHHG